MSQLVYILDEYEEHGPENITATLDKTKIRSIIENWPMDKFVFHGFGDKVALEKKHIENHKIYIDKMLEYFDKITDFDTVGECDLGPGWGGLQLHVVELK